MKVLNSTILILAILFALGNTISFRKNLMTFIQMAHESELIVKGNITSIDGDAYRFKVEYQLKGDDNIRELQVEKYRPWFCDPKRDDYEVGKAFLLFLNAHTEHGWHTINGSTGEARVLKGDSIRWNAPSANYPINQVFEGIEMALNCYQQSGEKCYYPICDGTVLDSLSQKNAFIKIIQIHQLNANDYLMIKENEMEERRREYLESIKKE